MTPLHKFLEMKGINYDNNTLRGKPVIVTANRQEVKDFATRQCYMWQVVDDELLLWLKKGQTHGDTVSTG